MIMIFVSRWRSTIAKSIYKVAGHLGISIAMQKQTDSTIYHCLFHCSCTYICRERTTRLGTWVCFSPFKTNKKWARKIIFWRRSAECILLQPYIIFNISYIGTLVCQHTSFRDRNRENINALCMSKYINKNLLPCIQGQNKVSEFRLSRTSKGNAMEGISDHGCWTCSSLHHRDNEALPDYKCFRLCTLSCGVFVSWSGIVVTFFFPSFLPISETMLTTAFTICETILSLIWPLLGGSLHCSSGFDGLVFDKAILF